MNGLPYLYHPTLVKTVFKALTTEFPIFHHHPDLVYLDNAATTQKPRSVIESISDFYEKKYTSTGRGLYPLATAATQHFESTRQKVGQHFGVAGHRIAFTKSATESINLVASGFLQPRLSPGDEVIITAQEHHANFIPWQQVCHATNARLVVIPINHHGALAMDELSRALGPRTRFIAATHITNVLGTINPIASIIDLAHQHRVPILVDAAQSAAMHAADILQHADFIACSGHKMFGPQGIGILYAAPQHDIIPLLYGGGAVRNVDTATTKLLDFPHSVEAGTPDAAAVAGLDTALDFIHNLDVAAANQYVHHLTVQCFEQLHQLDGIHVLGGTPASSMVAFTHRTVHPHDIATGLAQENICVRAGHHCAQPLTDALGIPASVRISFSIYNTEKDITKTIEVLQRLIRFWS
jgi:cysteine desulfurase/selenocysteine lyase